MKNIFTDGIILNRETVYGCLDSHTVDNVVSFIKGVRERGLDSTPPAQQFGSVLQNVPPAAQGLKETSERSLKIFSPIA